MNRIIHPADDRGFADHGWLKARHSFSFADYYRPDRMSFGLLRVLNDDEIAPGMGFGTHPHNNMEIVTVPLHGALVHRDSMGHEETVSAGEIQAMSAGSGITHSEYNASDSETLRLLQLWVLPREQNVTPQYDQKKFDLGSDVFTTLVSPDGRSGSLRISQDAIFSRGVFSAGLEAAYDLQIPGNGMYLFIISGRVSIDGENLGPRDAVGITETESVSFVSEAASDILCIEVPMM